MLSRQSLYQNIALYIVITIAVVATDLLSKSFMVDLLQNGNIVIFQDFILKLSFNEGIAFSLPVKGLIQILGSIFLLGWISWYVHQQWKWQYTTPSIALACITGGALGNLYERIVFSRVTDFIQISSWYPIFNLADIAIFFGVILLLFFQWRFRS